MNDSTTTDLDPDAFRAMMSRFPSGVTVVTCTGDDGIPRGMTCSAVCSVALDPPTLLVGVRAASPTLAGLLDSGRFAVNLLHERGVWAAEIFASGSPDRFKRVPWVPGSGGPHLVLHGHTAADCAVTATQQVGDHTVVFGEVTGITQYVDHPPLLYGLRGYRAWN